MTVAHLVATSLPLILFVAAAAAAQTAAVSGAVDREARDTSSTLVPPDLAEGSYDPKYGDAVRSAERSMTAEPMDGEEEIVLDGVLDEDVWRRAVPATDFIQQDPVLGGTPTERTEVRVAFSK